MLGKLKSFLGLAPAQPPAAPEAQAAAQGADALAQPMTDAAADTEDVLVHREVLDHDLAVCGVEFFVRGALYNKVHIERSAARRFLDGMLLDQLSELRSKHTSVRPAYLQLAEASLRRLGIAKLPPHCCLLLSSENPSQPAAEGSREAIAVIQEAGHQVWLDDCLATAWLASLAEQVDGVVCRMALRTPDEITSLLQNTRKNFPRLKLGAWDLTHHEDYELARKLGCQRFSGSFVTQRQDWCGNTLTPHMFSVASLINRVHEDADFRAIAQILRQDISASYRLLRYVNAASQGLSQRIASIEQALLILGQEQLNRWLTLILLTGGAMGDSAITEVALTRARFLELCGAARLQAPQCERLFVLGLFSMLDVALRVPLETAIAPLHLPDDMTAALLRQEGPFGAYLGLADACQRGASAEICRYALLTGLTTRKVAARQLEAIDWVARIATGPLLQAT